MDIFFEQSAWKQALIATIIISFIPNVLLVFLPEEVFKQESVQNNNGKRWSLRYGKMFVMFAVAGLLGDVFLHAIPHILHPHHDLQHSNSVASYHHVTTHQNVNVKYHDHGQNHDHKQSYQLLSKNNIGTESCECETDDSDAVDCARRNDMAKDNHGHELRNTNIHHHNNDNDIYHDVDEHKHGKSCYHNHDHHNPIDHCILEHESHHHDSHHDHEHHNHHSHHDRGDEHAVHFDAPEHVHSHETSNRLHFDSKDEVAHDHHDHNPHGHKSQESCDHDHNHAHDSHHSEQQGHAHSHGHGHGHGHDHHHELTSKEVWAPLLILTGFLVFYLADKIALQMFSKDSSHSHPHSYNHEYNHLRVSGWLNLVADAMHNFTDGITLGVACTAGSGLATATFLSVVIHELPHELSDFTILVRSGMSKWAAIQLQFVTAIAALVGAVVGVYVAEDNQLLQDVVGSLTAGGFVYIATVSLIPEALKQEETDSSNKESIFQVIGEALFFAAGVFLMVLVSFMEAH